MTASAATIIAMAADEINMSKNSLLLIHNAHVGVQGTKEEMKDAAEALEKIDNIIVDIYAERTGRQKSKIKALMNENSGRGKWLTAKEAKKFGLVDNIIGSKEVSNMAEILNCVAEYKYPELPLLEEEKNVIKNIMDSIGKREDKNEKMEMEKMEEIKKLEKEKEEFLNRANEFEAKYKELLKREEEREAAFLAKRKEDFINVAKKSNVDEKALNDFIDCIGKDDISVVDAAINLLNSIKKIEIDAPVKINKVEDETEELDYNNLQKKMII
jgi:hypothetical protein